MSREKAILRQNVRIDIGWQLGNYQMALKFHDETLRAHAVNKLDTLPDMYLAQGLISKSEKNYLIAEIEERKKKIEGDFKNGRI